MGPNDYMLIVMLVIFLLAYIFRIRKTVVKEKLVTPAKEKTLRELLEQEDFKNISPPGAMEFKPSTSLMKSHHRDKDSEIYTLSRERKDRLNALWGQKHLRLNTTA